VIVYVFGYSGIFLNACNIGRRLVMVVMNTRMMNDIKICVRVKVNDHVGGDDDEHENDERYDKAFVQINQELME
jgi:hypothetical protein